MKIRILYLLVILASCGNESGSKRNSLKSNINSKQALDTIIPINNLDTSYSQYLNDQITIHHLIGEWIYQSKNLFYYSSIKINSGNRFIYLSGGCTGKSYSEGIWKFEGSNLVLCSDKKYKNVKYYSTKPELPDSNITDTIDLDTSNFTQNFDSSAHFTWVWDSDYTKFSGTYSGNYRLHGDTTFVYFKNQVMEYRNYRLFYPKANSDDYYVKNNGR